MTSNNISITIFIYHQFQMIKYEIVYCNNFNDLPYGYTIGFGSK